MIRDVLKRTLILPDPNDRHVLAAAIVAHADIIVTYNLKDFPEAALHPFNIEAQHPDEFLRHLIDLAPAVVVDAVQRQQANLTNPPVTLSHLLALFERLGLVKTVAELR